MPHDVDHYASFTQALRADGWTRPEVGGFSALAGPYWVRRDDRGRRSLGLLVERRHCNSHIETLHGGVLMSFTDLGLGLAVADELGGQGFVTASLQVQFIGMARVGEFITCRPELVRAGRQLAFVRGLVQADDRTVASAEGIWKILDSREEGQLPS